MLIIFVLVVLILFFFLVGFVIGNEGLGGFGEIFV